MKPIIKNPNIIVGDYTYFGDVDFESHVKHHYDFVGDKLMIGKCCQIAAGVNFVMNEAHHRMNTISTYPFYIFDGLEQQIPPASEMPFKCNTIVGNDVWIWQNSTILQGVRIEDGVIIGLNSTVTHDVEPYTIVAGNSAKIIRKRFDDERIALLQKRQRYNQNIDEIEAIIPILSDSILDNVKRKIAQIVGNVWALHSFSVRSKIASGSIELGIFVSTLDQCVNVVLMAIR